MAPDNYARPSYLTHGEKRRMRQAVQSVAWRAFDNLQPASVWLCVAACLRWIEAGRQVTECPAFRVLVNAAPS